MTKFGELPPSGSTNQRLREILDGGYNYWVIRPLSSYQSRTALKKKIETRLRMANYGVSPHAVRAGHKEEAHQALQAAYRLILDEEVAEYKAGQAKREPSEGGFVAKLSDGRTRRFYGGDNRMEEWAAEQISGHPRMRAEFFHHESMAGGRSAYSKQPFSAIETDENGRVRRAGVEPLPPFNRARGSVTRGRKLSHSLRRRADGTFKPRGAKAKPKPRTCHCGAYGFPHAKGGGSCPK